MAHSWYSRHDSICSAWLLVYSTSLLRLYHSCSSRLEALEWLL